MTSEEVKGESKVVGAQPRHVLVVVKEEDGRMLSFLPRSGWVALDRVGLRQQGIGQDGRVLGPARLIRYSEAAKRFGLFTFRTSLDINNPDDVEFGQLHQLLEKWERQGQSGGPMISLWNLATGVTTYTPGRAIRHPGALQLKVGRIYRLPNSVAEGMNAGFMTAAQPGSDGAARVFLFGARHTPSDPVDVRYIVQNDQWLELSSSRGPAFPELKAHVEDHVKADLERLGLWVGNEGVK